MINCQIKTAATTFRRRTPMGGTRSVSQLIYPCGRDDQSPRKKEKGCFRMKCAVRAMCGISRPCLDPEEQKWDMAPRRTDIAAKHWVIHRVNNKATSRLVGIVHSREE